MEQWQENYRLLNPADCNVWDEPAPECVAKYRVYFDNGLGFERPADRDPYQRGIVVEEWKDGRFYMLDSNHEKVGTLAEVEAYLRDYLIREQYINEAGQILGPDGVTPVESVEPDSVQALFRELFPAESRFVWIIGGGSTPLDSVCGADCEATLRAAKALYERPEIDGDVIAKQAAKACEVYING